MGNRISKWIAAVAVVAASTAAAPAMACGGLFGGGCSPCGQAYVSPCGGGYGAGYGGGYGYGYGYDVSGAEQLPDPSPATPQYFYANQGPTFSGPGMYAPTSTYQETAIGWRPYGRAYGYRGYGYRYRNYGYRGYDGGPYANPVDYADTPAYRRPVIISYAPRAPYRARSNYRYGYAARYGNHPPYRNAAPGVGHARRYGEQAMQQRPPRRSY